MKFNNSKAPVFLTGIPRSGTTLLYTTLLRNTAFKSKRQDVRENILSAETHAFIDIKNIFLRESANKFLLFDRTQKDLLIQSIKPFIKYNQSTRKLHNLIATKTRNHSLRKLIFQATMGNLILKKYFDLAQNIRKVDRLLEKTPGHIQRVPEIKATFPESKIVFLYRHPVDVFSSYKKRLKIAVENGNSKNQLKWLNISEYEFCRQYKDNLELAFWTKRKTPDSLMIIKYEDFVTNPEKSLEDICSFIGEVFEVDMLNPRNKDLMTLYSQHLGGNIVKRTKNWSEFITRESAMIIETQLKDLMETLNYPKYSKS